MNKVVIIDGRNSYHLQLKINKFIYDKKIISIIPYYNTSTGEHYAMIYYKEEDR